MDLSIFSSIIKDCFLMYHKHKTKENIQAMFFSEIYSKVDRSHLPKNSKTEEAFNNIIDEFENKIHNEYFTEIDNVTNVSEVLQIFSKFVREKDKTIAELNDYYKTTYKNFAT